MLALKEIRYQLRYALPVWVMTLVFSVLPDVGPFLRVRGLFISWFLPGRPKRLRLGRDVTLLSINRLIIGEDVYLAKGVWINAIGGVEIQSEVSMAPYVVMSSTNHGFKDGSVHRGGAHPAPIVIGSGSWLASHVVIAAGVKLGRGSLVSANSVVTKDFPDNQVLGGVPAMIIKERIDNPSKITSKYDFLVK